MSEVVIVTATPPAVVKPVGQTAGEIVNDALQKILVKARGIPVQPEDMDDGLRYMNRLMTSLDSAGVALGFTLVSNPDDIVTIPIGAMEGLVARLAIRLAPNFGRPISAELAKEATDGLQAMRDIAVQVIPTCLPSTLPVGSGNEFHTHERFFPEKQPAIATEQNGNILLESDT